MHLRNQIRSLFSSSTDLFICFLKWMTVRRFNAGCSTSKGQFMVSDWPYMHMCFYQATFYDQLIKTDFWIIHLFELVDLTWRRLLSLYRLYNLETHCHAVLFYFLQFFNKLSLMYTTHVNKMYVLWFIFSGDMKKTCTGDAWRRNSTTGMSDVEYQMGGIHRGLLALRVYLEYGLGCLACSPRVLW